MLKRLFDFFVFSSLFIAICATLMAYQTFLLFGMPLNIPLLCFVFSGSVCSYNFHWYLTPPHVTNPSNKLIWNINNRPIHLVLFIVGLMSSALFAFLLIEHWFWLGVTALLTFLYSAPKLSFPAFAYLKKIAIGKTIFLSFAWAHVTSLLPLILPDNHLTMEQVWFVVNRFFFIFPICVVFDRRDVEEDRKAGIKSLVTYLNETGIDIVFWGTVIAFISTSAILMQWMPLLTVIILTFPVVILGLLYYPSKRNSSDYLYYFVLDGLMMVSAPLLILTKFAR